MQYSHKWIIWKLDTNKKSKKIKNIRGYWAFTKNKINKLSLFLLKICYYTNICLNKKFPIFIKKIIIIYGLSQATIWLVYIKQ